MTVPDTEHILSRFNGLMRELFRGKIERNSFEPWEVELLLDMQGCELPSSGRLQLLRQYQRTVQQLVEDGASTPLKFSEFLDRNRRKRRERA
jgi:hypothetical protein